MNFIHGTITILVGLLILICGPIEFRGYLVDSWVGLLICMFGFGVVGREVLKKKRDIQDKPR